jgi:hypothetical protein
MKSLEHCHNDVFEVFLKGHFTVSKTCKKFSSFSIDQAHEQLNARIKGVGGAIGLTENDAALTRWIVAGPEIMRLLDEFEYNSSHTADNTKQEEGKLFKITRFRKKRQNSSY